LFWRVHPDEAFFLAFREELAEELRRARAVYGELGIGENVTTALGRFLCPEEELKRIPKRGAERDAEDLTGIASVLNRHLAIYISAGAVQRAELLFDIITELARHFPDYERLAFEQVQAAHQLCAHYGRTGNIWRADELSHKAIAVCKRFPGRIIINYEQAEIWVFLHQAHLQFDGLTKAEEILAAMRRKAAENPEDRALGIWLAEELRQQLEAHAALGQTRPIWPLYEDIINGYEAFPYVALAQPLTQATATLCELFLTHDQTEELGRVADLISGLHKRRPDDRAIGILWTRVAHSLEVANPQVIAGPNTPAAAHLGQLDNILEITPAMLN
jgi:hypothetical protein